MTPERWQQVEEVLQAALDRSPHERMSFLNEACSDDEELRQETSSLVDAYGEAGDFIEEPAIALDAHLLIGNYQQNNIGREIGPYQIIERLGAGGMGEVYLAQDRRLDRQVALKILPPYFVSDEARLLRFQREARAASALNHPIVLTTFGSVVAGAGRAVATVGCMGTERVRALPGDGRMNLCRMEGVRPDVAECRAPFVGVARMDTMVAILEREPALLFQFANNAP